MKPKVKNIEVLAETKYLKLYNAKYTNKQGNDKNWSIASRKNLDELKQKFFNGKKDKIDAVLIIPYHVKEDKLVLVKQFRVPINDYIYELPAGIVDDTDKDFKETVKRELKEETGLNLISIDNQKSIKQAYVSVGMTDESMAVVYCNCDGEVTNKYLEEDEDIEVILLSKEEARKLLNSSYNIDVKTFLALQKFIS